MNIEHLLSLLDKSTYAQEKALPETARGHSENLFWGVGGWGMGMGEIVDSLNASDSAGLL